MCFVAEVLKGKGDEVWTVHPADMVYKALELMAEKNVGAVPVVEAGGRLVGMFSERDYARKVILKDKSSRATAVGELMSQPVWCVTPDDAVETCVEMMTSRHVRHLPVLGDEGLIGIISIGDVLNAIINDQQVLIDDLQNFIIGGRS